MSNFISIERNMRGFNYQRDWNKKKSFWHAMVKNISEEGNEIEWAKLFDNDGDEVGHYRRGWEIKNSDLLESK